MDNHPIGELMETTMQKIREMVDVNTIIGQPIDAAGMTLIPISKVSFGFASGGSDMQAKQQGQDKGFGGGSGAGVKIAPVAFVVVKDDNVRIMSVSPSDTPVDKLVDAVPDMIDKISGMFKGKDTKEDI
ncbi:MAG: GerW family sporulation protein [Oscillospiraceae bacterium]|jgi:sporulation protein YtfJ|nr:GerW family sporulation protein [Oscillospiraceae bacterium]